MPLLEALSTPEMTVFSGLAHRIINNYFIPKMAAVLAEGIMHRVVLVDIMRFLVGEDGDQASAIAAVDNRSVGVGGLAPGYKLSALDRAQRFETGIEGLHLFLAQIGAQPEINGVNKHLHSFSVGAKALSNQWIGALYKQTAPAFSAQHATSQTVCYNGSCELHIFFQKEHSHG